MMTLDQWVQLGILIGTIVPTLLLLHRENAARGKANSDKLDILTVLVQRHDKKMRRVKNRLVELEDFLFDGHARTRIAKSKASQRARPRLAT